MVWSGVEQGALMTSSQRMGRMVEDETATFVHEMLVELVQLSRQSNLHQTASVIEAAAVVVVTETAQRHPTASS